jgi:hypothetical protein
MRQIWFFFALCCSVVWSEAYRLDQIGSSDDGYELDEVFSSMFPDFSKPSDYVYYATLTPEPKIPMDEEGNPLAFEDPVLATSFALAHVPNYRFKGYWWEHPEIVELVESGKPIPMVYPFCSAFWDEECESLSIYIAANTKEALNKLQDPIYIHLIPRGNFHPHPNWEGFGNRLLVSKEMPQVIATFSESSILKVLSYLRSKITIDKQI